MAVVRIVLGAFLFTCWLGAAWMDARIPGGDASGFVIGSVAMGRKRGDRTAQVASVSEAIAIMGGPARVAEFLGIPRYELKRMCDAGTVDRGFFPQFFMTLHQLGYEPRPELFGLKSWRPIVVPQRSRRRRVA